MRQEWPSLFERLMTNPSSQNRRESLLHTIRKIMRTKRNRQRHTHTQTRGTDSEMDVPKNTFWWTKFKPSLFCLTEPEKPVMTVGPCFRFQSLTGAPACKLPEGSPDWVLITFSGSMVILLPSFVLFYCRLWALFFGCSQVSFSFSFAELGLFQFWRQSKSRQSK